MNISYEAYRVFYYTAKTRSFTQAANALGNSQPNITRIIKNLERELGCTLFLRNNRHVELTAEGETLYRHVSAAFEQLQAGEEALLRGGGLDGGILRIAATEIALHVFLLPVLSRFRGRYPGVHIRLFNGSTPAAIDELKELHDKGGCPCSVTDPDGKPVEFTFFRPLQYGDTYIIKEWPSFNALLEGYYAEKDRAERLRTKSKELHKAVHNMYERAVRKQAARQEELAASGKSEKLRLYGELLSANLYLAQKGMKSITVPNWYDEGNEVTIPLDLRFTPSQNAQNFFKNYKKKQTAARMLVDLLAEGEKQAAITRAEGEKESAILRAEAVKQQRIREAEGEAEALLTVQKAQADAIRMINEANPNHNYLALRSMEAMEKVADGKATKLIVPSDMQNLAATVSAIKEISGEVTE